MLITGEIFSSVVTNAINIESSLIYRIYHWWWFIWFWWRYLLISDLNAYQALECDPITVVQIPWRGQKAIWCTRSVTISGASGVWWHQKCHQKLLCMVTILVHHIAFCPCQGVWTIVIRSHSRALPSGQATCSWLHPKDLHRFAYLNNFHKWRACWLNWARPCIVLESAQVNTCCQPKSWF